jgi:hypothetical protein
MTDRDSIDQAKQARRTELAALQERADKVRLALRSLEGLGTLSANGTRKAPPIQSKRLHGVTMIKGAAVVLKDAHEPLHVNDIMERMIQGGYKVENPKTFRLSLVGSLDRGSRLDAPGWFYKPAPATYGLREWQQGEGASKEKP